MLMLTPIAQNFYINEDAISQNTWDKEMPTVGREQGDPCRRMGKSLVMLSRSEASRHLARQTLRCGSG